MTTDWQIGIDIGGTFTDVVAANPQSGETRAAKVATRVDDRVKGLLAALEAVGLRWDEVGDLVLGTTMVTNAIVEGDLAEIALISTQGFSDTLAIGRQNRKHLYHLDLPSKAKAQVPADLRYEVRERLAHDGAVLEPLDPASVDGVIAAIRASGVKAVAVSLLHSYMDPAHEEEIGRKLSQHFPFVALSNQVNPEAREYERTATTALSTSLMPLAAGQLDKLEALKPKASRLHLFHSAGGMAAPGVMRDLPLGLAMSGPAAGVAAAGNIANELGLKSTLSFDMGGTTTDVCLISDGKAVVSSNRSLGERPIRQPMVAVESIGAGGGSIARLDHGALVVGPQSAGADPGPACYGKGGTQPTVSDANLVLGYLDADRVLGSDLRLDAQAARAALTPLAEAMGKSIEDTALGIVRVANAAMVRALLRITVEQGIDGRQCTLFAFGGAGPMHAVDVAREFAIARVIVPACSSMFSALGCVSADMSYTRQQTLRMSSLDWDAARLQSMREAMRARLGDNLSDQLAAVGMGAGDIAFSEVAMLRYRGQSYAIEIADPPFADPVALGRVFQDEHARLYGFATDEPWELDAIRIVASVARPTGIAAITGHAAAKGAGKPAPDKTSRCVFEQTGAVATPRYDRAALAPGVHLAGPLIVEDAFSTVVVPPAATLHVDASANLIITLEGAQ